MIEWNTGSKPGGPHRTVVPSTWPRNRFQSWRDHQRMSGAMWCTEDNHYLGVRDVVTETGADLVMSACTTDWLF